MNPHAPVASDVVVLPARPGRRAFVIAVPVWLEWWWCVHAMNASVRTRCVGKGAEEGGRQGGAGTYFFFSAAAFLMESRVAKRDMAAVCCVRPVGG
jgi:hypothetical protein